MEEEEEEGSKKDNSLVSEAEAEAEAAAAAAAASLLTDDLIMEILSRLPVRRHRMVRQEASFKGNNCCYGGLLGSCGYSITPLWWHHYSRQNQSLEEEGARVQVAGTTALAEHEHKTPHPSNSSSGCLHDQDVLCPYNIYSIFLRSIGRTS